ncbi:MAG: hypothetical protein E7186_01845 [Erysipelotrichaceae bacterium]|nr:hypothetical protein [Erysipelotrichaceae bacterium]
MKKYLCVFLTLVLAISISSCSPNNTNKLKLNANDIKEIVGTSQMSNPIITKTFTDGETIGEITNVINSMNLTSIDTVGELKGWQYYFSVRYINGEEITISLSDNSILINGIVFYALSYDPKLFYPYFD